jgi:hypothetical protein
MNTLNHRNKQHPASPLCLPVALSVLALAASPYLASADTHKQGTICDETWTLASSPYRLIDNCTVPSGCTLTIQPGVVVKIDEGYNLNVHGQIVAVGTNGLPITFRCTQAGKYWNQIFIQHGSGPESKFAYCNFSDATNAVHLYIYAENAVMTTEFVKCSFSNCVDYCIYGWSGGLPDYWVPSPTLDIRATNCRFGVAGNGIGVYTTGGVNGVGGIAYGGANLSLANCLFENITGAAVWFQPTAYTSPSIPKVFNNLFTQCGTAIQSADPFDCILYNNIIANSPLAIQTSGDLSRNVYYNCLFNNQTNFVGYPSAYGRIDDVNSNGTPADAFMNITNNPLFCELTNYTLSAASPLIDAGNPAAAYLDNCFATNACLPGSLGTTTNDIGLWGGPRACDVTVPAITAQPQDQFGCLGHSATFTVEATGTEPLGYQWYFNTNTNTPLFNRTNASLSLTTLQGTNAGKYSVVVSNLYGSITSRLAQLTLYDPHTEIEVEWYFDAYIGAGLYIAGQPGATYVLKYATDLQNTNWANWTALATNTMDSSGWFFYLDDESPYSPMRFYQARRKP